MTKLTNGLLILLLCPLWVQAKGLNPDRELVYKTIDDVELKLHVFEPEGFKASDKRPAIVFFFGGGWNSGIPKQFYQQARAFADQGMVAFSGDYRVRSRNQTTPFECVKDAKSAIRYLREHAAELGVDPGRIVASGGSAGGHIAGCTGIIYGCEQDGEDKGISSVPNLMILYNPVLDTTEKGFGADRFSPEKQTTLSLPHQVRSDIVPTLLFHGTNDTTVPFENAERFTRLMKAAGNECILVPFEGKGHGFFNGSHFRARNGDDAFNATMVHSSEFLTRHGYLGANSIAELELVMPAVFDDHMVLQRGQKVPVWGSVNAGARVVVQFAGQQKSTLADSEGNWRVNLDALKASAQSRVLTIVVSLDGETLECDIMDVLVGEVWFAGGQSNMYRPFRMLIHPAVDPTYEPVAEYLRQEELKANDPFLRQYRAGKIFSPLEGQTVGQGQWSKAVVGPVYEFCAVTYFFGRELRRELEVPVAMISCNLGGTRIESWIAPQAYAGNEVLKKDYDSQIAAYKERLAEWDDEKEAAKYKQDLEEWKKAQAEGKRGGRQPREAEHPSRDKNVYGTLYNGMVHPLAPYGIKGAIWYQGESNSGHYPEQYGLRLTALIEGWRAAWGQEKLHFLWCQLANYKQANEEPVGDEDGWAWVQDGQRCALELPDTGMAVLNDIGEARDVHPKNKVDAGKRLSLWALKQTYGRDLVCSGPLYKEAKVKESKVIVTFNYAGSGLMVGRKHLMDPTVEVDEHLKRFQICGSDRQWKWAQATITGKDTVTVWHDDIKQPVEVRYAWSSNPEGANLYNKEGLPASIFKTKNLQVQNEAVTPDRYASTPTESFSTAYFEAEHFTSQTGGNKASTEYFPYIGEGYLEMGGQGATVTWNNITVPKAGKYTLILKYANNTQQNRPCNLKVNGALVKNIPFGPFIKNWRIVRPEATEYNPETVGWAKYWNARVIVDLKAGTNTLELIATSEQGGPHIDNIGVSTALSEPPAPVVNVKDHGAVGDGSTDNTEAIAKAIAACPAGGSVVFDEGVYMTGSITLKANMTLWVSENAVIRAIQDNDKIQTYAEGAFTGEYFKKYFLFGNKVDNLTITGGGTIHGNCVDGYLVSPKHLRPVLLGFINSQNVTVTNLDLLYSHSWLFIPRESENVIIDGINIYNGHKDGIAPMDCHDITITNSVISSNDDAMVPKSYNSSKGINNLVVKNLTINYTKWKGIKYGGSTRGDFTNSLFEDIAMVHTHSGLALYAMSGCNVTNIRFNRIKMNNVQTPFFIIRDVAKSTSTPGTQDIYISNIEVRNVYGQEGSSIQGTERNGTVYPVKNIYLTNVSVKDFRGGVHEVPETPREFPGGYPETTVFGTFPAWGYYIRHAENVVFTNVTHDVSPEDTREAIVLEDVSGFVKH